MIDHYAVTTTTPDRETAAQLAASAVREKLSATAQVDGPVTSYFWHLGEAGHGEEWIATFKTTSARYSDLEAHIVAKHVWNKPEVTAVRLEVGSADYLRWIEDSTTG